MLVATVNMSKQRNIPFASICFDVKEVRWDDIEVLGVKFNQGLKLRSANSVVTKLKESVII